MTEDDQIPEASMPAENSAGASEIASDDVAAPTAASGRRPMSAAPASPVAVTAPGQARASDLRPAAAPAPAGGADTGSPRSDKSEKKRTSTTEGRKPNMVRRIRIERMMSKAELARSANLSVLTIDRVEKGFGCRVDTKRKILEALGLSLADRVRVFGEEE